jgi:hypothetical protein
MGKKLYHTVQTKRAGQCTASVGSEEAPTTLGLIYSLFLHFYKRLKLFNKISVKVLGTVTSRNLSYVILKALIYSKFTLKIRVNTIYQP